MTHCGPGLGEQSSSLCLIRGIETRGARALGVLSFPSQPGDGCSALVTSVVTSWWELRGREAAETQVGMREDGGPQRPEVPVGREEWAGPRLRVGEQSFGGTMMVLKVAEETEVWRHVPPMKNTPSPHTFLGMPVKIRSISALGGFFIKR